MPELSIAKLTPQEMADRLNGRTYRNEIFKSEEDMAKRAGLVVVFGGSDDLIEFRGAIDDEFGAGNRTRLMLDAEGVIPSKGDAFEKEGRALERYATREKTAVSLNVGWCAVEGGPTWTYETAIPHATFLITDEDEPNGFCRGIVFRLADVRSHVAGNKTP